MKIDGGNWESTGTGKVYPVVAKGNPFVKPHTIIGIGLAIGGVLLATCGGWRNGVRDLGIAESIAFDKMIKDEKQHGVG